MFSKKESETNSGVAVSGTYQSQLKKAFPAAKITTSVKSWPQVGNSWTFLILLKSFSILKFAMIQWLLSETYLSKFFCYCFFFLKFLCCFYHEKRCLLLSSSHIKVWIWYAHKDKIEKHCYHGGKQRSSFFIKVHIETCRLGKRRIFL